MLIIESAGYRQMPWKNGTGMTTEIAVSPPGATTDDFDWRISMAQVGEDGWFSNFPNTDRTLAVLEGNGIALSISTAASVTVSPASAPLGFPADVPTFAKLLDGPIIDLNVMTRRNRFTHRLIRVNTEAPVFWPLKTCTTVILSRTSTLHLDDGAHSTSLQPGDSAFFECQPCPITVSSEGQATIYFIELTRI